MGFDVYAYKILTKIVKSLCFLFEVVMDNISLPECIHFYAAEHEIHFLDYMVPLSLSNIDSLDQRNRQ